MFAGISADIRNNYKEERMKKGQRIVRVVLAAVLVLSLGLERRWHRLQSGEPIKVGLMDTLTTTLAASLPWSHVGYELAVSRSMKAAALMVVPS